MTARSLFVFLALLAAPAHASAPVPERPAAVQVFPVTEEQRVAARSELLLSVRVEVARKAAANKDILTWGWALFPDKFDLPFCGELHGYFVDIRGADFTATEAPRGHAKTTIKCFLIPLFQALEEPDTFRHYLNVQAAAEKAVAINAAIKVELEENEALRALYGNQVGAKWTEKQFVLRNGVVFSAIGAGQSIRGINYRSLRPDYIVVDDLYDEDEIGSLDATRKRNRWFWGSLYKARAIGRRTSVHLQGTAANAEDLLEQLKKNKRWKHRSFAAVTDWEKKRVLWKEAVTFDSLMADMADMGSVIFFREMQNERRDDESAIVKSAWLEGWEFDALQLRLDTEFLRLVGVILGVDPSIGEKPGNDFTGVALVYKTLAKGAVKGGEHYWIVGLENKHLSFDGRLELLVKFRDTQAEAGYPITAANVEGIAGFKDFALKARGTGLPVKVVDKVPSKLVHLENKSYYFENRRVHLASNLPKVLKDALAYQLTTNEPKNDDLRDALLHCLDDRARAKWRPAA